jgi:NAD(P)-dependent dehydrogenase (short-subunit alcohol dehydrogenase family)
MSPHPIALITGASRGIGRAITLSLARASYHCIINYARNTEAAEEVAQQILSASLPSPLIVQADISISSDRQKLLDTTLSHFGRIDLLINNAGVAPESRTDLLEATESSFDRLININLKAPFFLTQLIARQMVSQQQNKEEQNKGDGSHLSSSPLNPEPLNPENSPKIITISSISAYTPSTNRADYCLSKAGLSMMTQLYASRLSSHNINVYEIRPGIIATDMTSSPSVQAKYDDLIFNKDLTPLKRWGHPEDIAKAVTSIATGSFPFSTGEVINVDGGFHLHRL